MYSLPQLKTTAYARRLHAAYTYNINRDDSRYCAANLNARFCGRQGAWLAQRRFREHVLPCVHYRSK